MMHLPDRIARLDRDKRGYPIPWNVLRGDHGEANFKVNDDRKHWKAIRLGLCPLCGEKLGNWKWFVGGPGSAFHEHGWYLDLPGHRDCMEFALRTCPYLALPRYSANDFIDPATVPTIQRPMILMDSTVDDARPELFVAIASDRIELKRNDPALPYVRPLKPVLGYTFWRHGEQIPAHRAMPILRGVFGPDWELPKLRDAA